MPLAVRIFSNNPVVKQSIAAALPCSDPQLELLDDGLHLRRVVLWVLDECVAELDPPEHDADPLVLLSLKCDFDDEELRRAGVAAYAGPGSGAGDAVKCLKAALEGRFLALRSKLPEPWCSMSPKQKTAARRILAGKHESSVAFS